VLHRKKKRKNTNVLKMVQGEEESDLLVVKKKVRR